MSEPAPTIELTVGGVLPLRVTLGVGPGADAAPSEGNDLSTRWREDLALLAEIGVTAVRFPFDWSRLQPRPGALDDDWRELYGNVLEAAASIGIDVWACLFEGVQPTWFDDDGGFADERAAGRWWPAWVEAAADAFGGRVAGWVPLDDPVGHAARVAGADSIRHQATLHHLLVAWRDAWRILRGGPPVATSLRVHIVQPADHTVPAREAARHLDMLRWTLWLRGLRDGRSAVPGKEPRAVPDLAGSLDVLGISTVADLGEDEDAGDEALTRWQERAGSIIRRAAEDGPSRPLAVTADRRERTSTSGSGCSKHSDGRRTMHWPTAWTFRRSGRLRPSPGQAAPTPSSIATANRPPAPRPGRTSPAVDGRSAARRNGGTAERVPPERAARFDL